MNQTSGYSNSSCQVKFRVEDLELSILSSDFEKLMELDFRWLDVESVKSGSRYPLSMFSPFILRKLFLSLM